MYMPIRVCLSLVDHVLRVLIGRDARNLLYWTVSPKQDTSKNDKNNNTRHLQLYGRSKSETRISASENARGRTPRQDDRKFHDPKKDEVECIRAR